ncbi:MAG: MaoC family dehydratase [Pseudomonadota bacterium]
MSNETMDKALETLKGNIGVELAPSEWFEMTQERINEFADVTMDHQWIHIDEPRSKAGPFGTTIAHGHLTLSIMGHLPQSPESMPPKLEGQKMGINYGFNKVRFPSPVPVGANIRTKRTLRTAEVKGGMIEAMYEVVVEVQGQDKPACVAESLSRMVF